MVVGDIIQLRVSKETAGESPATLAEGTTGVIVSSRNDSSGQPIFGVDFGAYGQIYCYPNEILSLSDLGSDILSEPAPLTPLGTGVHPIEVTPRDAENTEDDEDEELDDDGNPVINNGPGSEFRITFDDLIETASNKENNIKPLKIDIDADIARRVKEIEKRAKNAS